jgi:dTDP-4-dehydrorhamnose 3,5-epimerase-like enzyme
MTTPTLITLQTVPDEKRGLLCVAQIGNQLPFVIKRYFTLNGMKQGAIRGDHAHRAQSQYFNCLHGKFDVMVEGKNFKQVFRLDNPGTALNVPPMHWVTITSLEDSGTMLVCASDIYDAADYICDRAEFDTMLAGTR